MRRPPEKKSENHERWVISYADFTTLLLATFVVMYAVSSINSSKFQEMAEAFSTAFMGKIPTIKSSGMAAADKGPFNYMPSPIHAPVITREPQVKNMPPGLQQEVQRRVEKLDEAYEKLTRLLASMISKGEVRVSLQPLGVVIDINAVVLFQSARAELTSGALQLIEQVASVLKDLNYRIQVNGYTDNAQIHSAQFKSNWDLSAARAISVVKRFVLDGIDPRLLVGAGYGEYHPVASNDTLEGMGMNRRVSIVVVSPVEGVDPSQTPLLGEPQERDGAAQEAGAETSQTASPQQLEAPTKSGSCDDSSVSGGLC
jgi:chemotaxis protein MotB